MRIGVPKEIKPDEHRVALLPQGVAELVARGHVVYIEKGAGKASTSATVSIAKQARPCVLNASSTELRK